MTWSGVITKAGLVTYDHDGRPRLYAKAALTCDIPDYPACVGDFYYDEYPAHCGPHWQVGSAFTWTITKTVDTLTWK